MLRSLLAPTVDPARVPALAPALAPTLALALALCAALAGPAGAEPSALRRAETSARLFEAGRADADPLLMLAAARLRQTAGLAPGAGPADDAPMTWAAMLAAAEALAPGDAVVAGLAADIRADAARGVATGALLRLATLAAGGTDRHEAIAFRGGEYAEVYVEARTETDIALVVEDAGGVAVCADTAAGPIAYCGWRPAEAGQFTIRVENRGPRAAGYALMTN
jgi:hypothetical protein